MGKPSEQIRCNDWTAGYVLDDAVLAFGTWVDNEVKRYASYVPSKRSGSKDTQKPPTAAQVVEYQRALVEGTPFRRIVATRRLTRKRERQTAMDAGSG